MKFRRLLPPPRRLGRWMAGTVVLGLVTPTAAAAMLTLAGYFPIGSWLPPSPFWSFFGIFLAIVVIAVAILFGGALYSLLTWSWRPIALAALFELCLYAGIVPSVFAQEHMQLFAFELLEGRSSEVVGAIANYARVKGVPPATLTDLVPAYLPSVPPTGIAMAPNYDYKRQPGPCNFDRNGDSKWHLSVWIPQLMSVHHAYYCPEQGKWFHEQTD